MSMAEETPGPISDATRRHLQALRRAMLRLHGAILQVERVSYEREHGRVNATELFRLLTEDEFFGWFRPLSELVVQVDQLLDSGDEATDRDVHDLLREVRSLVNPMEHGEEFGTRYRELLQQDPEIILTHAELSQLLKAP